MGEEVILVDESDNQIGTEEKIRAHENGGKMHRAFSIFIFNSKNEMLLQKRAEGKYHCGGLWTNTCCSHQRPDETLDNAIHRKLKQEMGFDTELKEVTAFKYRVPFENGLTEHEYDHVFFGKFDEKPEPNPDEVCDYKWISVDDLEIDVAANPDNYTPWFKIILGKVLEWYKNNN